MLLKYDEKYRNELYSSFYWPLFETRHIVIEFNDAIKYIMANIQKLASEINNVQYIGWNWHISLKKCLNDNNENSGYPIYVVIDDTLPADMFAYIEKWDLFKNKIMLHINIAHINDFDLQSKLNHEFVHIRTMYSKFFINPLENKKNNYEIKNLIYYFNIKNRAYSFQPLLTAEKHFLFNNQQISWAGACLYHLSKTEQEARLNQVYKYIVQTYHQLNIPNRKTLIQQTDQISLMSDFISIKNDLEDFYNNENFKTLLCISFYLNKYGHVNYDILNDDTMLKYFNIIDGIHQKFSVDLTIVLHYCLKYIEKNLLQYQQKINNIIDDAISDIKTMNIK